MGDFFDSCVSRDAELTDACLELIRGCLTSKDIIWNGHWPLHYRKSM